MVYECMVVFVVNYGKVDKNESVQQANSALMQVHNIDPRPCVMFSPFVKIQCFYLPPNA